MSDPVFRLMLPGADVDRHRPDQAVIDRDLDSLKIDTEADPAHAGIIFLDWKDPAKIVPIDNTILLDSFKHDFNQTPIVVASYKFENGTVLLRGTLPFQLGALGLITMDTDEDNVNLKYYSTDFQGFVVPPFLMQLRYYVMANPGY